MFSSSRRALAIGEPGAGIQGVIIFLIVDIPIIFGMIDDRNATSAFLDG
jgi:hypothetical protein